MNVLYDNTVRYQENTDFHEKLPKFTRFQGRSRDRAKGVIASLESLLFILFQLIWKRRGQQKRRTWSAIVLFRKIKYSYGTFLVRYAKLIEYYMLPCCILV